MVAGRGPGRKTEGVQPQRGGFDDNGRPGGGLWLSIGQTAELFSVGCEAVRKWRVDPEFPEDAEVRVEGRVWLNPIRILFWRLDCLRQRRSMTAAQAVEAMRASFRGLPGDESGKLAGWFV